MGSENMLITVFCTLMCSAFQAVPAPTTLGKFFVYSLTAYPNILANYTWLYLKFGKDIAILSGQFQHSKI